MESIYEKTRRKKEDDKFETLHEVIERILTDIYQLGEAIAHHRLSIAELYYRASEVKVKTILVKDLLKEQSQ